MISIVQELTHVKTYFLVELEMATTSNGVDLPEEVVVEIMSCHGYLPSLLFNSSACISRGTPSSKLS